MLTSNLKRQGGVAEIKVNKKDMASGSPAKTRAMRVASIVRGHPGWKKFVQALLAPPLVSHLAFVCMAVAPWCLLVGAWDPPFPYRSGDVADRPIVSRVDFTAPDPFDLRRELITFRKGQILAEGGQPLTPHQIQLLRLEHATHLRDRPLYARIIRLVSIWVLMVVLLALSGVYLRLRAAELFREERRLMILTALALGAAALAKWLSHEAWRGELIPLLVFSQGVAIALGRELAMLFGSLVALATVLALGQPVSSLLVLLGVMAVACVQLGHVRTRSKLIHVGIIAGIAAFGLTLAGSSLQNGMVGWVAVRTAFYHALWTIAAGFLIFGLLQPLERVFGVLTDISLLELADMSQPLLQELLRRAPGTHNHSVLVGAMAEAAAEAIGARGLLARVGAYYHDIGKMVKPEFFVENQTQGKNLHDSLRPAMSSLVIMSHVKDGVNLARQYRLPQVVIDFIEQHHGTTLVRYFYDKANEESRIARDLSAVDESTFRYMGPKPQTKEIAIVMLADSVESACRTLEEPTPSCIAHLVRQISRHKLEDGQFDECGLTLQELRKIENSLISSLVANYHGRIKYQTVAAV